MDVGLSFVADPADAASTSCPNRSASPGAATPTKCPSAARTGSPSVPRGRMFEADRLSAWPDRRKQRCDLGPQAVKEARSRHLHPTRQPPFC